MVKLMRLGFIVLLFISERNLAQQSHIRFEHLSTRQGLSNNFISSICQDREGFLWFGTADGLNKFDGYSLPNFNLIRWLAATPCNIPLLPMCIRIEKDGSGWPQWEAACIRLIKETEK